MQRLLTHAVALWAGGFVALYWIMDHVARESDAMVTRTDILLIAAWPYYAIQYIWSLV